MSAKLQKTLQKVAITVFTILFGFMLTITSVTWDNKDTVSAALGQHNAKLVDTEVDPSADLEYYKSDYKSIREVVYAGLQVQEEEQSEGTVLLTNKNNALPLAKGSKVSVFGAAGALPFYGASGSGGIGTNYAIGWYDAMRGVHYEAADPKAKITSSSPLLNVNEKLATNYTNWTKSGAAGYNAAYVPASSISKVNIGDVPWNVVSASDGYADAAEYSDAAIYVIKRTGGEGYDLPATSGKNEQYNNVDNFAVSTNDGTNGDYLQLSPTEISVLEGLKAAKAAGTVKKVVLILNMASAIQLDFLKANTYDIDSCLWVGSVGVVGTIAVAKTLVGEYNPSGGAASTLWADHLNNPINNNFTDQNYFFTYENYETFGFENPALTTSYQSTMSSYMVYQEGMYMGYKYTETRYEDYVLGTNKVGDFNYNETVAYPFGFGKSYSTFKFSNFKATKGAENTYSVSVDVKNTSTIPGKSPVQIYVAKPNDSYAKSNQIQVPTVELIEFGKTKLLGAGATETVNIVVDEKYFASYDAHGAGTYITMANDYYLVAAANAHEATNNLLAAKGKTPANTANRMDAEGDASLTKKFAYRFDTQTFSMSSATGNAIQNTFSFADINTYTGKGSNSVKYYDRNDWSGTVREMTRKSDGTLVKDYAKLVMTQQMATELRNQMDAGVVIKQGGEYPTYGKDNKMVLLNMKELSFENPLWEDLLDQMTWDETVDLLSNGRHKTQAIASVAKPATGDENGPNGLNQTYAAASGGSKYSGPTHPYAERVGGRNADGTYIPDPDLGKGYRTTGFSSNGVLAATFNKEIAAKVGKQIGEEGLWAGMAGLLGTGLNILRSPYAGRTAEYYSECAMLSGLIAAPQTLEIERKGVHCFIKHVGMNESETARHGVQVWATEQTMRENYLRAFEIVITKGGAFNVMTAFNRYGTDAVANCVPFTKKFLRNECGLPGIVETDAAGDMTDGVHGEAYISRIVNVYTGATDLNEYNYSATAADYEGSKYSYKSFAPVENGGPGGYGNLGQAMRAASKRILYAVLNTNAMSGLSATTRVVRITPPWQIWVISLDVVFGALLLASVGWTATSLLLKRKSVPTNKQKSHN